MGKPKQVRSFSTKSGSTVAKGRMLEKIVAEMHHQDGAVTETNVKLPPLRNAKGIKREIDVLVTTTVANVQVRVAFECKNEKKLTGTQEIDVFARKLEYVGIPTSCGVFVSVAGYTQGALENAKDCGIKTLLYEDVNKTLPLSVINAVQSVLYVLCELRGIYLASTLPPQPDGSASPQMAILFIEEQGQVRTIHLADMLWHMWTVNGTLPDVLGEHEMELPIPPGAFMLHDGKRYPILFEPDEARPKARVRISGLVFSFEGETSRHLLKDAQSEVPDSFRVNVKFDPKAKPSVQVVSTEAEFDELTKPNGRLQLIAERFRLPRIVWNKLYWPPSQRVMETMRSAYEAFQRGEGPDPLGLGFEDIEGRKLASVWEPISPEWPLYQYYLGGGKQGSVKPEGSQ